MAGGFSYFDRNVPSVAIHSLFDKYDTRKDGKLDENEMKSFLEEALGLDFQQSEIYFFLLDKDGDQGISYDEFKEWLRSEERFQRLDDTAFERVCKAYEYFKTFDTDHSGNLDREQFGLLMTFLGYPDSHDMDKAFARMNRHSNGKLSFWEFMIWLNWAPIE